MIRYKVLKNTSSILFKLYKGNLEVIDLYNITSQDNTFYTENIVWDEYNSCCFWENNEHPFNKILSDLQIEKLKFIYQHGYIVLLRNHKKSTDSYYFICVPTTDIIYINQRIEHE